MSATSERILSAALSLYNEKGVAEVSMREIAARIDISVGNLAYHFRNQDYIIESLFHQMVTERDAILSGVQQIPSFENINRQLLPLLQLGLKYRFFYLDTVQLVRTYPKIAQLHRSYIGQSIQYIKAVIDYSVGSGNMHPESSKGQYRRLARTVWMLINFWLAQLSIRGIGEVDISELRRSVWELVIPHLTRKGRENFKNIQKSLNADHSVQHRS